MTTILLLTMIVSSLLVPSIAYADGGGPLLLIMNGITFLYGGILIVIVEWLIYIYWAKIPKLPAFWDALIANIASTLLVGFGLPLLIAAVSAAASFALPPALGDYALALGTWVYEGAHFPKLIMASIYFWYFVTFFLTVFVETIALKKLWKERQYEAVKSACSLSWISNAVTYFGLLIYLIWELGFR